MIEYPIGMNAHVPDFDLLEKIREAGIKGIRCDFNWHQIEPEKGRHEWTKHDLLVNYCYANGININASIGFTPEWATDGQVRSGMPRNIHDWINFVFKVTKRYKGKVEFWSIWNEPNEKHFFSEGLKAYGEQILATASRAIRQVDPHMKIIAPSISTSPRNWPKWLNEMQWYAERQFFDILSFHTYRPDGKAVIQKIEKNRSWSWLLPWRKAIITYLKKFKLPIWITETGWSTAHVSEEDQWYNYQDMIQYIFGSKLIHNIFFYEMKDDIRFPPRFGILDHDLDEKPAYENLRKLLLPEEEW